MSTGLIPIVVEVFTTLLFCGVLIYLRKKMTRKTVALWVALWVARGAVSLAAMRFLAGADRLVFLMYAPLQVAIAMALVMIAVRLESQKQQLRSLNDELARLRKDAEGQMDLDPLTGLKNRSALAHWMDEQSVFDGLVVVSDMDDFKSINDKYGHLVGDEILHGVGKLIRSSIRETDLAFRWGWSTAACARSRSTWRTSAYASTARFRFTSVGVSPAPPAARCVSASKKPTA